jgi:hypothetical protein
MTASGSKNIPGKEKDDLEKQTRPSAKIDSKQALKNAHKEAIRLLDVGDPGAAITFVDSLKAAAAYEDGLKRLRGIIYTDAGYTLKQLNTIQRGAELFRELKPEVPDIHLGIS